MCAKHRLAWLLDMQKKGMKNKVAMAGDEPVGFIHLMPMEMATMRLGVCGSERRYQSAILNKIN